MKYSGIDYMLSYFRVAGERGKAFQDYLVVRKLLNEIDGHGLIPWLGGCQRSIEGSNVAIGYCQSGYAVLIWLQDIQRG